MQPQDFDAQGAAATQAEVEALVSVVAAVERDLAEIRTRDERLAASALAATALAMAAEIDDSVNSATSKSMCAARLQEALDRLRELTPPEEKSDGIDRIGERVRLKLAGGTAT